MLYPTQAALYPTLAAPDVSWAKWGSKHYLCFQTTLPRPCCVQRFLLLLLKLKPIPDVILQGLRQGHRQVEVLWLVCSNPQVSWGGGPTPCCQPAMGAVVVDKPWLLLLKGASSCLCEREDHGDLHPPAPGLFLDQCAEGRRWTEGEGRFVPWNRTSDKINDICYLNGKRLGVLAKLLFCVSARDFFLKGMKRGKERNDFLDDIIPLSIL